ncbi:hypothetical protein AB685_00985 [Bacillus sp. LL01]|uniref:NAD(P)H-dependent flavin oxidoreductase n=1 Tax=Bacillus sp. LL01 TaxID=1665556 RepID=UPI00064D1AE6|nr:nitronate monooxygenase [Bacillus sp. LL01]KMJ59486.1 hypothetical protein AB685_00985 [Bacillus sp. LL01]
MKLKTPICSMLNIDFPVIQAGMAGGVTTPELVAAVSEAGGLGMIGAGYMTPEELKVSIDKVRSLTDKTFGVNIFKVAMAASDSRTSALQEKYIPIYEELDIIPGKDPLLSKNYYHEQFDLLIDEMVPVISTTFGIPGKQEVNSLKEKNIILMTMVTSVQEALEAQSAGVHILVAQGSEAGGHRGTFHINDGQGVLVGTMALIPQVVDAVQVPVVAAGGIMDGRGLVASLALGAQGVQLGSRFLHVTESGTDPTYQNALLESTEVDTVITSSFTGRPARAVKNKFTDLHQQEGMQPLNYPIQNLLTSPIRSTAKQQGNQEYLSLWAGQGVRMMKSGQSVDEVMREIVNQSKSILDY